MTFLDQACGKTEPPELPDVYAADIPDSCPWCLADPLEVDADGCCEDCGGEIEP